MNIRNPRRLVTACALLVLTTSSHALALTSTQGAHSQPLSSTPYYDSVLDATFGTGIEADGSARTHVRAADLRVDKRVTRAGTTTLILRYGNDRVTFTLTPQGITVTRGDRTATLSLGGQDSEDRTAVRALLLGSTAVRAFRAFTAALEQRNEIDRPELLSTMLDGAVVGVLDGDEAAAERVAKRIGQRGRAGLRRASQPVPVQFQDCLGGYERALMRAWDEYIACITQSTWLQYIIHSPFCALEYLIRAEQYIFFQMISCMALR